jgi:hypothetical protein
MEAAAGTHGGKRNHEEISDMMALVEAARKVRAATARPCAQGQMGSQCGWRERLWPSSADVSLDVTSVANAFRASREACTCATPLREIGIAARARS